MNSLLLCVLVWERINIGLNPYPRILYENFKKAETLAAHVS